MVSVDEAERIILSQAFKPIKQTIAIQYSYGKIVAEEIKADRDLPPFNRATMDGVAISFESFERTESSFLNERGPNADKTASCP